MITYNKLVRDRIPEIIEKSGKKCIFHIADEEEYNIKLREKLCEETAEFLETPSIEELADVFEVLEAILEDTRYQEIDGSKIAKRITNGGFENRIILDGVENQ